MTEVPDCSDCRHYKPEWSFFDEINSHKYAKCAIGFGALFPFCSVERATVPHSRFVKMFSLIALHDFCGPAGKNFEVRNGRVE